MSHRADVTFASAGDRLAAWLVTPEDPPGPAGLPVVVMAHGLGAVKEMGLDAYAERFAAAGYACVVFDYRHFGGSTGEPRQLLSIRRQVADWHAVLAWVRGRPELDAERIALWGTSFGGGHVIRVAAEDGRVAAAIAQCPFTDGLASARAKDLRSAVGATGRGLRDLAAQALRRPPVLIDSAGPPGSTSLMSAPDSEAGYLALALGAPSFRNQVAARFAVATATYVPGRHARRVTCPLHVAVCDHDTVAPPRATLRHVRRAPRAEVVTHACGHFDIYLGEHLERACDQYVDFLDRHLAG